MPYAGWPKLPSLTFFFVPEVDSRQTPPRPLAHHQPRRISSTSGLIMASMSMSLHAVNHRLTNIPVKQLPPLASCLAASLSNCGELLASPQTQKAAKSDSDNGVQVHKLMTRLTSLLQDRTPEGRWTAVVLVKAVIEAGQWEVLRACEPFVRGLMAILTVREIL